MAFGCGGGVPWGEGGRRSERACWGARERGDRRATGGGRWSLSLGVSKRAGAGDEAHVFRKRREESEMVGVWAGQVRSGRGGV